MVPLKGLKSVMVFIYILDSIPLPACQTFNMAVAWRPRWQPILSAAILAAIVGSVVAKNIAQMSVPEIEDAIQVGTHSLGTQNRERPRALSYRN